MLQQQRQPVACTKMLPATGLLATNTKEQSTTLQLWDITTQFNAAIQKQFIVCWLVTN
jgi:hypothetical protein